MVKLGIKNSNIDFFVEEIRQKNAQILNSNKSAEEKAVEIEENYGNSGKHVFGFKVSDIEDRDKFLKRCEETKLNSNMGFAISDVKHPEFDENWAANEMLLWLGLGVDSDEGTAYIAWYYYNFVKFPHSVQSHRFNLPINIKCPTESWWTNNEK